MRFRSVLNSAWARVVLDDLKMVGGNFRAGWPAQRTQHTAQLLALLALLGDGTAEPCVLRETA